MSHKDDDHKWREDFPYETENDEYVGRREFARFLLVASGGLAAGNALVLARSRMSDPPRAARVAIARVSDLAPGCATAFNYPDAHSSALLVRRNNGDLAAFDRRCTHLSCPVTYQTRDAEAAGEALVCHCHRGRFDVASGAGTSGPPRELRPLRRILLEVVDGTVFATGFDHT